MYLTDCSDHSLMWGGFQQALLGENGSRDCSSIKNPTLHIFYNYISHKPLNSFVEILILSPNISYGRHVFVTLTRDRLSLK